MCPACVALLSPRLPLSTRDPDGLGQTVYRIDEMTALWADLDMTFADHSLVPTHC